MQEVVRRRPRHRHEPDRRDLLALARRNGPGARLGVSPTQLIDRSRTVAFDFEGRAVEGYEGDTIALRALRLRGPHLLPQLQVPQAQGLLCAAGSCANCLMTVDGVPNVRTCAEPARSGLAVRGQNAWPSVERDALSALDKLGALMPVGFYYKTFPQPEAHVEDGAALHTARRRAGQPRHRARKPGEAYTHRTIHADVAVVGGGPSGLSAALAAAGAGAARHPRGRPDRPRRPSPVEHQRVRRAAGIAGGPGFEIGARLAAAVRDERESTSSRRRRHIGLYQDNLLGVLAERELVRLRARERRRSRRRPRRPLVFERNDLPA